MEIEVSYFRGEPKNNVELPRKKGNSLAKFIDDYCVIDIETTGLDPRWDDVIEISALRVRGSEIVDDFSTLVIPEDFDHVPDFIEKLTGISTDDILNNGISPDIAINKFYEFIGSDILVGHNVNFDINFLYDHLKKYRDIELNSDFVDTMRIARRALPDQQHHRLKDLVKTFDIKGLKMHRALNDCTITKIVYDELKQILGPNWELIYKHGSLDLSSIISDKTEFDQSHMFFDKYFVFTGKLESFTRQTASQIVADRGGHPQNGINSETNYLVIGSFDYIKNIKDGMTGKQKKAIEKQLKGQDIQILTEDVFLEQLI